MIKQSLFETSTTIHSCYVSKKFLWDLLVSLLFRLCEKTAGAAHCLMSSAAGEMSFTVKAPSLTAPPCGLCLHQQPLSLSVGGGTVPWVRIIPSKSYLTQYFTPLFLISPLHRRRGSNRISLSFYSTSSRSPPPLPSQADWLSSSPLLHNTGRFQFSSFSFKRAPPLCLFPANPPSPYLTLVSLGSVERRRGQS